MAKDKIRFVQLSDIHLFADSKAQLLGVSTKESLAAVLKFLPTIPSYPIDFIILSGDLTQDGTKVAYDTLFQMLKPFAIPVYWVPGNHDNVTVANTLFPQTPFINDRHILLDQWQIILLNSQQVGKVPGFLDQAELKFLEDCLQQYKNHRAIILFHHQPIPVNCQWLDKLGLINADEFWQIATRYPNVHTVLFGHVHQEFSQIKSGIHCYSAPSTCIQFKRNQDHFGLENLPPGFRLIELDGDGQLNTQVYRIKNYIGTFDANAKGY